MKRVLVIIPVVCLLASPVLSGCGQKSYFESKETVASKVPQDTGEQEVVPTDTPPQEVIVKVYVYNDSDAVVTVEGAQSEDRSGLVDINTAGRDELMGLSGIGATRAEAIIAYRDQNGSFSSIEDIKDVSGIGESTFEKIKDKITV